MGGERLTRIDPSGPDLAAVVAAFGHALHTNGLPVTPEQSIRFATAITLAEPRSVPDLYWIARVTLVTAHEQIEAFDAVFAQVFAHGRSGVDSTRHVDRSPADAGAQDQDAAAEPTPEDQPAALGTTSEVTLAALSTAAPRGTDADGAADDVDDVPRLRASAYERLDQQHFATLTAEDLRLIEAVVAQTPVIAPLRRGRRARVAPAGPQLDLRASLRTAQRTGGDPVRLVRRSRTLRPRRVVLLTDVSGSMAAVSHIYLLLMRQAVRATDAEAFAFATRLHRLTRRLRSGDPDDAYRSALADAPDWAGGTRIGQCLKAFVDEFGQRGLARGAVVVIVSDGWDTGDLSVLDQAMARIARLAHRVVWVNPRSAAAGFEPTTGGMRTVLPYVDNFVSGHSLAALREVLTAIAADTAHTAPRRTCA